MPSQMKTPGVYIVEPDATPNTGAVQVATAVPAFIGYTPQAAYHDVSVLNKPTIITSLLEFEEIYCLPLTLGSAKVKQYNPQYYLLEQPTAQNNLVINGKNYALLPDANTIFYLYNSIKLFYANGGGKAYIVSVGGYGAPSGKPIGPTDALVNPNIKLAELQAGLTTLLQEEEPTLYFIPDATLLSAAANGTLMQAMLQQCNEIQSAISIFDVKGGKTASAASYANDIVTFRQNTGTTFLNYGAAYYPFVCTNVMQAGEIDYTNLFGGDIKQLAPIINPPAKPDINITAIIKNMTSPTGIALTETQHHDALHTYSETYNLIVQYALDDANTLPPSGAIAGIMTMVDNSKGVWAAPANVSVKNAVSLPLAINDDEQTLLNVDPLTGKSINAIRQFTNEGILVWGDRTMDGNSDDWRYINIRRTMIMLEQSLKSIAKGFVFAPNTAATWVTIKGEMSNFLTDIWKRGGLQGDKPEDAFTIQCGLGDTMTPDDLLDGLLRVAVQVAVNHPAEFIEITFQQQMQAS